MSPAKPTVFLSASLADAEWEHRIVGHLQRAGVDVITAGDLPGGMPWQSALRYAIDRSDTFVGVYSDRPSPWAEREAEAAMDRNLTIIPIAVGPRPAVPARLKTRQIRVESLSHLDRAADDIAEQVAESSTRHLGGIIDALRSLAAAAEHQHDHAAARAHLEHALALRSEFSKPDDEIDADLLVRLAPIIANLDDAPAAYQSCERALAVYKRLAGDRDPAVTGIRDEVDSLIWDRFQQALKCSYLGMILRPVSERSPETDKRIADFVANFTTSQDERFAVDTWPEAETIAELHRDALGAKHPGVGLVLAHLGAQLRNRKDVAGAKRLLESAYEVYSRSFRDQHPILANVLIELGMAALDEGDIEAARGWLRRATSIHEAALGADHPAVTTLLLLLRLLSDG